MLRHRWPSLSFTLIGLGLAVGARAIEGQGSQTRRLEPGERGAPAAAGVYKSPGQFRQAIQCLGGPRTVVNFDELDAGSATNTYLGRQKFDGITYANSGITFASPLGKNLYIAPGGLFWNATNSLSLFRSPFDPAPGDEVDSLEVTLTAQGHAACAAVAFTLVDLGDAENKHVRFLDSDGAVVTEASFPDPAGYAFLGIVSVDRPIAKIEIDEGVEFDGDDVDYDDFICVRAAVTPGRFTVAGTMPTSARADEFRRAAARLGFQKARQPGSHERWVHEDGRSVTIPIHGGREIGPPLFYRILEQLGITADEFGRLR